MCGIAGLLLNDPESRVAPARLRAMVDALTHRGPDDSGFHVDGPIGLGVRRLAIVDVAGGHQPISNEDGTIWVVYNGECYNFTELRAALESAGHRFVTRTDTEILVHGYEQWGIEGLAERLNGIYAFCLWDARCRGAHLVRDRLGVKPLYYVERASGVAFSSELRSLIRSGLCLPKIDDEAVWSYLLYQFPPGERTPLAGVRRLPAGHRLEWRPEGRVKIQQYWDLLREGGGPHPDSFEDAAAQVGALLDDAVRRQLMSDVPLGCFLSGGLDSSAVAALMARHSSQPLRTYSIAFPDAHEYDETSHAVHVASVLGARHTTVPFDETSVLDHLDDYLARIDEPVADAAMLPTDLLARTAARDVKVVLTGEGADEVFAGYAYYRRFLTTDSQPIADDGVAYFRDLAAPYRRAGLAWPIPGSASPHSGFPYSVDADSVWLLLDLDRRPSVETFRRVVCATEDEVSSRASACTPLQRALYVDTKIWLGHDLMTKLDKSTMAHSLEARVPMLDHRLVEMAFGLPDTYKIGPDHGKRILRHALRSVIPEDIRQRSKQGFGVPLDRWFRTVLRPFVQETLLGSALIEERLLSRSAMQTVIDAHCDQQVPVARLIWSLITLTFWWRQARAEIIAALPEDGAIPLRFRAGTPTVDLVIPVYKSLNLVRDCVRSIRAWTNRPFHAFLVQDGADADISARLRALIAGDRRFEIVVNEQNVGYVQSCIRGMQLCSADYIVLLNSDVVVAPGWIDRMVACAESDPRIAAVNPLTNESGNTSVRLAPGLNVLTMARRVAALSRRQYPDITTAVGMCLLIRRAAIELLGGFDSVFEHAYCEESDLCMRFSEAGLRVVAADDAFVYHKGMGSYSDSAKNRLYERNRRIFDERWAVAYERDWTAYARRDPLQYMRDALLRATVGPFDDPAIIEAIEHRIARLDTRRALRLAKDGDRVRSATTLLAGRSPWSAERERVVEWGVWRQTHPPNRFDERALTYPTQAYVRSLPAAAPNELRITFLVDSLPLCGGVISIAQLARAMMQAGHDVKFVTQSAETTPELLNLWAQPLVYRSRAHLIDAFPESDIVIATYWTTAHQYLAELRRRHSFVSVYFIQDYEAWFYDEADHRRRQAVVRSYAAAEHHIVKSRWLADKVGQHGPRCEIVPLGLDLGVFFPRRPAARSRPRVISVAGASRRRGLPETVEIFRRLHVARPDIDLVFFGCDAAALPPLSFPCTVAGRTWDQNQVAELLSSADVLVDASWWQGFGRPGLEAMACGTVPVLTDTGGLSEYARHGENCLQASPSRPGAFVDAVIGLLDDRPLYERLSAAALTTASRFSHEIEAERHLRLYRQWIQDASVEKRHVRAGVSPPDT